MDFFSDPVLTISIIIAATMIVGTALVLAAIKRRNRDD